MNDEELAARLRRWRPAEPPPGLAQQLATVLAPSPAPRRQRPGSRVLGWLASRPGPWQLAYTGLFALWLVIWILRLNTPSGSAPASAGDSDASVATTSAAPVLTGPLLTRSVFQLTHDPFNPL